MVFEAGVEPATFRLSGERSNQLSYTNIIHYLEDTLELSITIPGRPSVSILVYHQNNGPLFRRYTVDRSSLLSAFLGHQIPQASVSSK